MQPINDDMDELFRRAGEEYPLNTDGADWNKVAQQLHPDEAASQKIVQKKKDFKYLLLLLLLPIGFICGRYISNDKNATNGTPNDEVTNSITPKDKTNISTSPDPTSANSRKNDNRSGVTKPTSPLSVIAASNNTPITRRSRSKSFNKAQTDSPIIRSGKTTISSVISSTSKVSSEKVKNAFEAPKVTRNAATTSSDLFKPGSSGGDTKRGESQSLVQEKLQSNSQQPSSQKPIDAMLDSIPKTNKQPDQTNTAAASREMKTKKPTTFKPGFAYSLVIGPDVSTIKAQKTSKLGYSLGVLLKYQLTQRIAVEAGAMWDRKNYFTDGRYLDTTRLKLPMHSIVKTAAGYCNMVEIPVNVRYHFSIKQKHSWFASAGLSSYLMNNEDYDIVYERYNQTYSKVYGYTNSTKDWFSIMNLSVGYQKTWGKYTNIGIAPYVKVPLRGVGIGKLPVSSTGIFLSVSRSFK